MKILIACEYSGTVRDAFAKRGHNAWSCDKVAIENPISLRVFNMPEFSQEIQPYEYGHPFSKKTRLWLKGLPNLKPTNIVEKKHTFIQSGTSRYKHIKII